MAISDVFKKYGVGYGSYSGINKEDFLALDKTKQVELLKELEKEVDARIKEIKDQDKRFDLSNPMSRRYYESLYVLGGLDTLDELREMMGKKTVAVFSGDPSEYPIKEVQVEVKYGDRNPLSFTEEQMMIGGKPARSVEFFDYDENDNISNTSGKYYFNSRIWPKYKALAILVRWDKPRELENATSEEEKTKVDEKFNKFQGILDSIDDPETKVVFCYDENGDLVNILEAKEKDIPIDLNIRYGGRGWRY